MHPAALDEWSRRSSLLHSRNARAKIIALFVLLIAVATTDPHQPLAFVGYALLLMASVWVARLPLGAFLLRLAAISPVLLVFAAGSWISGDEQRAGLILVRGLLSGAAALLLIATTPAHLIFNALQRLHLPAILVSVIQTVHRYLFVLESEAAAMRTAARARSAAAGIASLPHAAAAMSVLFARSHHRAQDVHRAMLARGYSGHSVLLPEERPLRSDAAFLALAASIPLLLRFGL